MLKRVLSWFRRPLIPMEVLHIPPGSTVLLCTKRDLTERQAKDVANFLEDAHKRIGIKFVVLSGAEWKVAISGASE